MEGRIGGVFFTTGASSRRQFLVKTMSMVESLLGFSKGIGELA